MKYHVDHESSPKITSLIVMMACDDVAWKTVHLEYQVTEDSYGLSTLVHVYINVLGV